MEEEKSVSVVEGKDTLRMSMNIEDNDEEMGSDVSDIEFNAFFLTMENDVIEYQGVYLTKMFE